MKIGYVKKDLHFSVFIYRNSVNNELEVMLKITFSQLKIIILNYLIDTSPVLFGNTRYI